MAVRSRRFATVEAIGTTRKLLYAVPAGRTAVVKVATATNYGTLAGTLIVRLAGGAIWTAPVAQGGTAEFLRGAVFNPGDVIEVDWTAATATGLVSLFGSLLFGAPE